MRLILSISIFVLSMGGFAYGDVLKLVGDDDVIKTDTATVSNDDAIKEESGIEVEKRHHVQKGDTLWDLAIKYYAQPFKWGIIYNANIDAIQNPDLIYPEEGFIIPGIKEKIVPEKPIARLENIQTIPEIEVNEIAQTVPEVKAEEIVVEKEIIVEAKKTRKFKIPVLSEEMPNDQTEWNSMLETDLADKNWSGEGFIVGKEDKMEEDSLAFGGDIVKIKMKFSKKVSVGHMLSIYKFGDKVYDNDGKFKGNKIQKVGIVEVIEVDKLKVKAVVVQANSSIMKGMIVKK
ncbi:MAG: LysM peptidoglycan-binding domain-containing protein [Elusimicrobia bacterium]|nr:LysM peptidoglycan-binding domain-containing protein [Elusimicrobiota bacterium]